MHGVRGGGGSGRGGKGGGGWLSGELVLMIMVKKEIC